MMDSVPVVRLLRPLRILFLLLAPTVVHPVLGGQSSVVNELDAYYSSVGLYYNPSDEPLQYVDSDDELTIYRDLFMRSYAPRDVVLEASVYPMPIFGVLAKQQWSGFYDQMQWSDEFNLIKSVTLGFDEPYALSLFLGNVVKYRPDHVSRVGNNKGYMGYLFSIGNKHIKDNTLIDDNWWEFEWKVKGDRERAEETLSWSFRVGGKWHGNTEIADVYYLGLRRNHLNFDAPVISWLVNSGVDYEIAWDQRDGALVEQQLFFDKKLPVHAWQLAFDLQFGFIWRKRAKYLGSLADEGNGEEFYLVLRPQIDL